MNDNTTITEEFRNISPRRIDLVCREAEKVFGEHPGERQSDQDDVRSLLEIVTALIRENRRKDAIQHHLENVFSNPEVIEAVRIWYVGLMFLPAKINFDRPAV